VLFYYGTILAQTIAGRVQAIAEEAFGREQRTTSLDSGRLTLC
jgi:hypothetical protein